MGRFFDLLKPSNQCLLLQDERDRKRAQEERDRVVRESIRLLVLRGRQACKDAANYPPEVFNDSHDSKHKKMRHLHDCAGGIRRILRSVETADWRTIFSEAELAPWLPEFVLGLRLSGAVYPYGRTGRWVLGVTGRAELSSDAEDMPLPHRTSEIRFTNCGEMYIAVSMCPGWSLPAQDIDSPSLMAGWLAGCRMIRDSSGVAWLQGSGSQPSLDLLKHWGIVHRKVAGRGGRRIRVSPFYGAVLSPWMPLMAATAMESIAPPAGMSPLLPAVYWYLACDDDIRAGALPYLASRATIYRRGWRPKDLGMVGLREYGVTFVHTALRNAIWKWRDDHPLSRDENESGPAPSHPMIGADPQAAVSRDAG